MDSIFAAKSLVLSALDELALPNERMLAEAGVVGFEGLHTAPNVSSLWLLSNAPLDADWRPLNKENEFS